MRKKYVVVFGGSGFLGSHVADEFTNQGYEVTIYDIKPSKFLKESQKMIVGDILDRESVNKVVRDNDIICHFAAIADIEVAKKNPVNTANFNIIGTMHVLEACRKYEVERFMFASSVYVYSEHGSFYRSSKQACELFIENYQKEYGLKFTIMRYGSLYGPRANQFNFIHSIIKEALLEGTISRKGDGKEVRSYINVLDAAKSSVEAVSELYTNRYLMITGSQTIMVGELLNMVKEILNDDVDILYSDESVDGHYKITPYSFKPKVALKMSPKDYHDLGQGILETIHIIYQDLLEQGLTPKIEGDA